MADVGQRLEVLLEAIKDGIYIIGQDFTVEYMNRAMQETFGNCTGKKCYSAINGLEDACPWCRADEIFREGRVLRWEFHMEQNDCFYEVTELPLANQDGTMSKLSIFRDITRVRRQEEKLKVSEQDYLRLFENVDCGIYISSREGKFLDANPALLKMFGYSEKEEFLSLEIAKDFYMRPEDRKRFQEIVEREGKLTDYEVTFKRKDGTPVEALLTAQVRYDIRGRILGYEGIITDQTQRKAMEKKLTEANDFFNKLIQASPNAIMAADMKGNIIIWNHAAEEMLGYRAEEVLGRMNIVSVYPEGMARQVMKMLRSPEYGGVGKLKGYQLVAKRRDGVVTEANLSAAIIYDQNGRELASVGIMVDLAERLAMERKLSETQQQLLQSEKLAAMGRLTSQVAHELNNPLYGIMNTLELVKTEISPDSRRRKLVDMALSETVRLSDLLRKMLSFSKPDQELKREADVNTVLDEILLLHEKQLRERDINVVRDLAEELPTVWASKNQLRQVFLNMIANARDAMPEGGTLTVTTEVMGDMVAAVFSDTGTGIKAEHLDKIFDAFFTTKDSVKGVGLGLSVCYGFIRDHGGDIRVESEPGKGTTFTITIPVYHPEAQAECPAPQETKPE
ncbi:MAG: PAS domain S-box protein [Thermodesulfobacteriota bacterium]